MRVFVGAFLLILLTFSYCLAQEKLLPSSDVAVSETNVNKPLPERRTQIEYLRRARGALASYLSTVAPGSEDYRTTKITIEELDLKLQTILGGSGEEIASAPEQVNACSSLQPHPEFSLAVPAKGRTNLSPELALTWTEDRRNGTFLDPPLYNLKRFRLVVATDADLRNVVCCDDPVRPASAAVTASSRAPKGVQSIETSALVPEGKLETGTKYYWQIIAVYTPEGQPDSVQCEQKADERPSYFITSIDPFRPLIKRNFSLQRTVDSIDPTEGAQFSFLKSFGKKTVFSTDFAFFWDSPSMRFAHNRGFLWFRPAVEGKLTSDESTAEDAWRFSGSAVLDYNFITLNTDEHNRIKTGTSLAAPRKFIDSLYFELGGNLESDQGFDTRKLASRVYFSPSSRLLAIGTATGTPASPVQFIWRPSVEFNAGHTFRAGDSTETGKTILRLVPKVRMTLYTRGLSRLLRIANSDFFADNTFYYLPKDQRKTRHNLFTSGFELFLIKNFGFGLTYKNGESAPKFRPVHSFGGTLTLRFGPE